MHICSVFLHCCFTAQHVQINVVHHVCLALQCALNAQVTNVAAFVSVQHWSNCTACIVLNTMHQVCLLYVTNVASCVCAKCTALVTLHSMSSPPGICVCFDTEIGAHYICLALRQHWSDCAACTVQKDVCCTCLALTKDLSCRTAYTARSRIVFIAMHKMAQTTSAWCCFSIGCTAQHIQPQLVQTTLARHYHASYHIVCISEVGSDCI